MPTCTCMWAIRPITFFFFLSFFFSFFFVCFPEHFFIFFLFSFPGCYLFFFLGCGCDSSCCCCCCFLTRHDFFWDMIFFFFLVNKLGDFFLSLFRFNWQSFFINGIWVNLYKFTFSIPPLFHSQKKKKRDKLKSSLSSHFSILPLFHSSHQTNPKTKTL